ncbi:MAG: hypothetical protein V1835_05975, partial [Candidatus Micrarchaeota archaeon]
MEKNHGFVFTVDAMFSLAALALLALVYVVISSSHFEILKYSTLENQGRDFLYLNHILKVPVDPGTFASLTMHNITAFWNGTATFENFSEVDDFTAINGTWSWRPDYGGIYSQVSTINAGSLPSALIARPGRNYYFEAKVIFHLPIAGTSVGPSKYLNGSIGVSIRSNLTGARYGCIIIPQVNDAG